MDSSIIIGIATVIGLAIIFFWAYSKGKDYDSKKKKIN
jgi:predicted histidine transporter YuiF (NhaC family)